METPMITMVIALVVVTLLGPAAGYFFASRKFRRRVQDAEDHARHLEEGMLRSRAPAGWSQPGSPPVRGMRAPNQYQQGPQMPGHQQMAPQRPVQPHLQPSHQTGPQLQVPQPRTGRGPDAPADRFAQEPPLFGDGASSGQRQRPQLPQQVPSQPQSAPQIPQQVPSQPQGAPQIPQQAPSQPQGAPQAPPQAPPAHPPPNAPGRTFIPNPPAFNRPGGPFPSSPGAVPGAGPIQRPSGPGQGALPQPERGGTDQGGQTAPSTGGRGPNVDGGSDHPPANGSGHDASANADAHSTKASDDDAHPGHDPASSGPQTAAQAQPGSQGFTPVSDIIDQADAQKLDWLGNVSAGRRVRLQRLGYDAPKKLANLRRSEIRRLARELSVTEEVIRDEWMPAAEAFLRENGQ